jgi:accessory colonization factor AcfC
MRKITVYQEGEVIELFDDAPISIDSVIKETTKLFNSNNIAVLQVSNSALVVRPSKLNSILIEEMENIQQPESLLDDTVKEMIEREEPKKQEIQEDIITDAE